jgi:hypothetical protein
MLRPHDIAVLLKLSLLARRAAPTRQVDIASSLGVSQSEIHSALKRTAAARLYEPERRVVLRQSLLEFLVHGIRYAFPAKLGEPTRGVPTAWMMSPLSQTIVESEDIASPVWPHAEGTVRGAAVEPLNHTVPGAAMRDPELHELLALVDAIRIGGARERKLAVEALRARLSSA